MTDDQLLLGGMLDWFRDHPEVLHHTKDHIVREARQYQRYGGDHEVPSFHGVYFLVDSGEIVYVGKAQAVCNRLCEHWLRKKFDSYWCFGEVPYEWLEYIEHLYIQRLQPRLNRGGSFKRLPNLGEIACQLEEMSRASSGAVRREV